MMLWLVFEKSPMTKKKDAPFNNPFNGLKLEKKAAPFVPVAPVPLKKPVSVDDESTLFLESVGEVAPVRTVKERVAPPSPPSADQLRFSHEEAEGLARLAELVSPAADFETADEAEYLEGSVRGFDDRVMRKLRRGEFEVESRLDLHGRTLDEAKLALENFIQRARILGHRCVLVVTGRGLHSVDNIPVLKRGVQQWLVGGRVARQVLGFCSAQPDDGGTGAVYVLLRR